MGMVPMRAGWSGVGGAEYARRRRWWAAVSGFQGVRGRGFQASWAGKVCGVGGDFIMRKMVTFLTIATL